MRRTKWVSFAEYCLLYGKPFEYKDVKQSEEVQAALRALIGSPITISFDKSRPPIGEVTGFRCDEKGILVRGKMEEFAKPLGMPSIGGIGLDSGGLSDMHILPMEISWVIKPNKPESPK